MSLYNVGLVHERAGRRAEARSLHERALAIRERVLGRDHPDVATSLNALAGLDLAAGRYASAEELLRRAIAIREAALGPGHADLAVSLNNLADTYWTTGRHAEAQPLYERVLTILEQAHGVDSVHLAHPLQGLAAVALALDRPEDAAVSARRAVRVRQRDGASPQELGWSQFTLSQALWAAGDRLEARQLADEAERTCEIPGSDEPNACEPIRAWLKTVRAGR